MRTNKEKGISILLVFISLLSIGVNTYAHSGRTDSSGGHKDKNNVSGLGYYHYHCGGHPAHLHENGKCPYASNQSSTSSSSSSSGSNNNSTSSEDRKPTSSTPITIAVTEIKINESIENMEIGENKKLTATITPDNATDKSIIWKSSDESIVTISEEGEIEAKKAGSVEITASTNNGKTSIIKVTIKEEQKVENSTTVTTSSPVKNEMVNNISDDSSEDSNSAGEILTLGLLGTGGYWIYKKRKNSKKL